MGRCLMGLPTLTYRHRVLFHFWPDPAAIPARQTYREPAGARFGVQRDTMTSANAELVTEVGPSTATGAPARTRAARPTRASHTASADDTAHGGERRGAGTQHAERALGRPTTWNRRARAGVASPGLRRSLDECLLARCADSHRLFRQGTAEQRGEDPRSGSDHLGGQPSDHRTRWVAGRDLHLCRRTSGYPTDRLGRGRVVTAGELVPDGLPHGPCGAWADVVPRAAPDRPDGTARRCTCSL